MTQTMWQETYPPPWNCTGSSPVTWVNPYPYRQTGGIRWCCPIAKAMQVDGVRLYLSNCLMDEPGTVYTWGVQPTVPDLEEQPIWQETLQWLQTEYPPEACASQTSALKGAHSFRHPPWKRHDPSVLSG